MKALSLPINMIVIVAIAVLVLVVTAGFFGGFFAGNVGTIQFEQAFNNACNQLRNLYNCDTTNINDVSVRYQASGDSEPKTYYLGALCHQKLGIGPAKANEKTGLGGRDVDCVLSCGCPRPTR